MTQERKFTAIPWNVAISSGLLPGVYAGIVAAGISGEKIVGAGVCLIVDAAIAWAIVAFSRKEIRNA